MPERYTPNEIEPAHEEKSKEFIELEKRYIKLIKEHSLLDQKLAEAKGERRKDIISEMRKKMKEIQEIEKFMELDKEYTQLKDNYSDLNERLQFSEGQYREDLKKEIEKIIKKIQEVEEKMKESMPYNILKEELKKSTQKDLEGLKNDADDTRIV